MKAATTASERLRILYDGLREARFARKSLHPDIGNLDLIFLEQQAGNPSTTMIEGWEAKLQRELEQGRLRAEFAFAFGKLLDEWVNPPETGPEEKIDAENSEPWRLLLQEPPPVDLSVLSEDSVKSFQHIRKLQENCREYGTEKIFDPVTDKEIKALLSFQGRDDFRQPHLRRQALDAARSDTVINELADTLTILLNNIDDWDWPSEGVRPVSVRKNQKWRPYLDESLVQLLFVQLIGLRWGMQIKTQLKHALRGHWVNRKLFWNEKWGLKTPAVNNLWSERNRYAMEFPLPVIPDHIENWVPKDGGYGRGRQPQSQPTHLEKLLQLVNTELQFLRASSLQNPVHVAQADLRNYYMSIPHAVLFQVAERFGVPDRWLAFLKKYLAIPLQTGNGVEKAKRGLILGHLLGTVLADLLLFILEMKVFEDHELRLFRVVDDLFFLTQEDTRATQAWQTIRSFCQSCGLEINEAKSGAVCVGGEKANNMPDGLPRWGILQLHEDGRWKVDEVLFDKILANTRQEVQSSPTVLGKVARYNENLAYVHKNLALTLPLGEAHFDTVAKNLSRMHNRLFAEDHGMLEELNQRFGEIFLDSEVQSAGPPEALLYWPITAGGLGLTHPLIIVAGFRKSQELNKIPAPPETDITDWTDRKIYNRWITYYRQLQMNLTMFGPSTATGMERLVQDFIARGGEVGGREQKTLSPYWRWIVYTYGPSVLDSLGTFRFLLTELVPLQLIFEGRIDIPSLSSTSDEG